MKKILILGAGGQIASWVIAMLADRSDVELTLFLRNPGKLRTKPAQARIVQGDVLNAGDLTLAMAGQDIVYANLTGDDLDLQAKHIVDAIRDGGLDRLIFVTSLGIYDEVPGKFGEWNRREIGPFLPPFRRAADVVTASGLNYTLLRPAWLTDADEVDYETTEVSEPFKGTEVSRKSVAALIVKIVESPELFERQDLGVNKPNTDGDRPAFL